MNKLKELYRQVMKWLTAPSCQARTYSCCSDKDEDEEDKPVGFAY